MTCRDCLHYEACLGIMAAVGIHSDFFGLDVEERCDTFADRAKYILKGEPKTEGDRIRAMNDQQASDRGGACAACRGRRRNDSPARES